MSFQGKHALVTGSSRGIALRLAEKGARIAIHSSFKRMFQADVSRASDMGRIFGKPSPLMAERL